MLDDLWRTLACVPCWAGFQELVLRHRIARCYQAGCIRVRRSSDRVRLASRSVDFTVGTRTISTMALGDTLPLRDG
jgi:hypothetical protein